MAKIRTIQIYRGTTAQNEAYTGSVGELTMDTDNNTVHIHDGSTLGGHTLANKATTLAGYGITDGANTDLSNLTATGKVTSAHLAMPSNRSIDLTLPASGGTITAPADGYIHFAKNSTAANQRIKLYTNTQMAVTSWSTGVNNIEVLLPVSKGETVSVVYNAGGTTNFFRFTYANGAQ